MIDFLKRLLGIKPRPQVYATEVKPCLFCGGRHIRFVRGTFYNPDSLVCNDCGFSFKRYLAYLLIREWDGLPRKEHTK